MPYVKGPVVHGVTHVADVYNSPNVFINNVPVALWLAAQPGAGAALTEVNTVPLSLEQQNAIAESSAKATSSAEADVGLTGRGEVPHEGPLVLASTNEQSAAGQSGNSTTSTFVISTSSGNIFIALAKNIDGCLTEAKAGKWKETGSNTKILSCYKAVGFNINNDSTPWCAAFAGNLLKSSGAAALKTLSSLAYRGYGQNIDLNDKSKWRLNDIIVFSRNGGGHIGFFRGYNPSTNSVLIAGGNQSDNLTEVGFKAGGMPIVYVGRGWAVPAEYDKPVLYSGTGSTVKVV